MASEPVTMDVRIPQQELDDFGALISELQRDTGRDMAKSVEQVARFFLQSAGSRNATPISKTKRPVEANPDRTGRGQGARGKKWRFKIHTQGASFWRYTDNRTDPARVIQTRGLARNSWKALIAKMPGGTSPKLTGSGKAISRAHRETERSIRRRPDRLTITTKNKIPYLAIITPNVQRDAMRKAINRLDGMMQKAARKQEAKWRT